MATRLWRLRPVISWGGRNVNDTFGNGLLFRSDLDFYAQGLKNLGNAFINVHKTILTPDVRILRVVISPVNIPGQAAYGRGKQTTVGTDTVGTRALGGSRGVFEEAVAVFFKGAAGGTTGSLNVRGAYLINEVSVSSDRKIDTVAGFDKTALTAYGTAVLGVFTAAACPLVLPAAEGLDFVTGARIVTDVTYNHIALRDANVSRKSVSQLKKELANREIHELERQLEEAQQNGQGVGQGSDFFAVARDLIFDAMLQAGIKAILKISMPPALRLIALAAAALSGTGGRPQLPA